MITASNDAHTSPPRVIPTSKATNNTPHLIPIEPDHQYCKPTAITPRQHRYNTHLNVAKHGVNTIVDKSGKALEYRHLTQHPKYKHTWSQSMSNELGRLTQGNGKVNGTNTIFFIPYHDIPQDRKKGCHLR